MGAAVLAVIQAVPALLKLFSEVQDLYWKSVSTADQNQMSKVQKERDATLAAIKQPGLSNEQRSVLRRRLYDLAKL